MTTLELKINRDLDNDILYVIKHSATGRSITNLSVTEDIVLRLDRETKEIVGFIIDDFSRVFPDWKDMTDYHLSEEFNTILKVLNDASAKRLTAQVTAVTP